MERNRIKKVDKVTRDLAAAYAEEGAFFGAIQRVEGEAQDGEYPTRIRDAPKVLPGARERRLPVARDQMDALHARLSPDLSDAEIASTLRELPVAQSLSPTTQMGKRKCRFCASQRRMGTGVDVVPEIDAFNVPLLVRFVNTLGMMKSRRMTGVCAKHQRKLRAAMRRAVHLGFFSFKNNAFSVHSPFKETSVKPDDETGELIIQRPPPPPRETPPRSPNRGPPRYRN